MTEHVIFELIGWSCLWIYDISILYLSSELPYICPYNTTTKWSTTFYTQQISFGKFLSQNRLYYIITKYVFEFSAVIRNNYARDII